MYSKLSWCLGRDTSLYRYSSKRFITSVEFLSCNAFNVIDQLYRTLVRRHIVIRSGIRLTPCALQRGICSCCIYIHRYTAYIHILHFYNTNNIWRLYLADKFLYTCIKSNYFQNYFLTTLSATQMILELTMKASWKSFIICAAQLKIIGYFV